MMGIREGQFIRRFRIRILTVLLLVAIVAPVVRLSVSYRDNFGVPQIEGNVANVALTDMRAPGFAPDPFEASNAILELLEKEVSATVPFSGVRAPEIIPDVTLQKIVRTCAADARSFRESPKCFYTRLPDLFYINSWRCDLGRSAFYRPFGPDAKHNYRIAGRFARGPTGKWRAEAVRLVRMNTYAEFLWATDPYREAHGIVQLVPTPSEAKTAILHSLRNQGVARELGKCDQRISQFITSPATWNRLNNSVIKAHDDFAEVDGWKVFVNDLAFERSILLSPGTADVAVLTGYFELAPSGEWKAVPIVITAGCIHCDVTRAIREASSTECTVACPFPPPLK